MFTHVKEEENGHKGLLIDQGDTMFVVFEQLLYSFNKGETENGTG